ncbi:MAG: antitoxin family protein [Pirellulaceae bacterium]
MPVDGIVQNGMIVPDGPLTLPEGTRVRIEVASELATPAPSARQGGWWRDKVSLAEDFDELPADIAAALGLRHP